MCHNKRDKADRITTGKLMFMNPTPEKIKQAQQRINKKAQRDAEYNCEKKAV